MSESVYKKRPALSNYNLTKELPDFFQAIAEAASKYEYVSAKERRCFNLVRRYLPDISNLYTNNGLLLQYKVLAEHYKEHHRLPRILLVDDIMVYGRGVAKFLRQLEQLVSSELERMNVLGDDDSHLYFRYSFTQAIEIYIYARNSGTLFLDDRFFPQLTCWKSVYPDVLRDLSMQLSDMMIRWEVANTSFVPSFRSTTLTKLIQDNTLSTNKWKKVRFTQDGEDIVIYIRLFGDHTITRISTLRIYPQRNVLTELPQITTFSLMGELQIEKMNQICDYLGLVFKRYGFDSLVGLLAEKSDYLQKNRFHLLYYIISSLDFIEFCHEEIPPDLKVTTHVDLRSDFNKIACNFGPDTTIAKELSSLITLMVKDESFKKNIYLSYQLFDSIIDVSPQACNSSFSENTHFPAVAKAVKDVIYRIGMNAEANARQYANCPNRFNPNLFQEYSGRGNGYGSDGVISLNDFFDILKDDFSANFTKDVYFYVAAYIAMMDCGYISSRLYYDKKRNVMTLLKKAGELSTSLLPRQLALYIPALSLVEEHAYRLGLTELIALKQFVAERNVEELSSEFSFGERQKWEGFKITADELAVYKTHLDQCGQKFRDWNFPNLVNRSDTFEKKYQLFAYKKARHFLHLDREQI